MAKQAEESCEVKCPVYELMQCLCGKDTVGSKMLEHFDNARVEVLLGIRELLDSRIEELQKKPKSGSGSRRIKVTEKA